MHHIGIELGGWATTHVGKVRKNNEDAFVYLADRGLFAVADGMGGHRAGEVASRMAVDLLRDTTVPDRAFLKDGSLAGRQQILDWLAEVVMDINLQIHRRSLEDDSLAGMGCTLEVILFRANGAFMAHVGDSRTLLLRAGGLYPLTQDHTLEHLLVSRGATPQQAARHPQKASLVRAMGPGPDVEPDVTYLEVGEGDVFLLCTDGLHGLVAAEGIQEVLQGRPAKAAPQDLVDRALEAGGLDNVTALVVAVEQCSVSAPVIVGARETFAAMAASDLFQDFSDGELLRIQKLASACTYKAGTSLLPQGRVGTVLGLPLEGTLSFWRDDQPIGRGGRGDHYGDIGLVGLPSAIAVRAEGPVTILEFPLESLKEFLKMEHGMAAKLHLAMFRRMAERAAGAADSVARYRRVYGPTPI